MIILTGFYLSIGEDGFLVSEDRPEFCKFFVADYYSPLHFQQSSYKVVNPVA